MEGNGGKQGRRRRRADVAVWSDGAVRLLVTVMRLLRKFHDKESCTSEQQQGDNRSKQVWKWVALALQNKGHAFDAAQCKTKFKSLKADYHAAVELLDSALAPSSSQHVCDHELELAKFRFFSDMRHYFLGSSLTPEDLQIVLQTDETPEEFVASLMKTDDDPPPCRVKVKRLKSTYNRKSSAVEGAAEVDEEEAREYRMKKLELMEKKMQLAEQRLQLELVRAENERQRLDNECRRIDIEERKMKQHEEQLMSTANIVNSLLMLLSQHMH